ncbi:Ig-like domain-containing protein [Brevibacillus halotolerans]|uniref:Ig-like domain-containing protein n=1 Tax=Brevibacillus halotolerans TaxID=1507437 RepID=UPI001BB34D5E|nr:Ig-like domain-containing protein [Brevibacillus halotolerans]
MSKSMEVDDPKRLANAIQYMSNNLVDFKDEFVDSVVEYTVQTSKFLDTPEKLATLVGEIGKLGVWSDDKALDALKESSLKFTNQDDVTRPSTAVYSYRQNYRGTVTNPGSDTRTYTYYYRYAVTIEYADNFNPTLTLLSPTDNQMLTENATLSIQRTASDIDKENVVTVKYQVNKGTARALQSGVSNGSTPISFAKTLTFKSKRLYDGATDIVGADLAENTGYTLTVWAEDDQGGKSTEITRKFRVVHNRPPVISGQNEDLGTLSSVPMKKYTVTEPEGDEFTITKKLMGK